jgi:patatin-like phospholipase/acyl hydrolase
MAAPGFFKPVHNKPLDNVRLDGGLCANCPVKLGICEYKPTYVLSLGGGSSFDFKESERARIATVP